MTEQVNNELSDDFSQAFADSLDSAASEAQEFTAESFTGQTGEVTTEQVNEPAQQPDAQQDEQQDPWAVVPESLRNQYQQLQANHQRLEADHRANSERVQALNRKTTELQQALAAREAAGGKQSTAPGTPSADDLEGMSFEEVEQEFPELAKFIKAQVSAAVTPIQQQLAPVQQLVSERQQAVQEQVIQQELGRLAQVHPDFKEVASSPDFDDWVKAQPPMVQQLRSSFNADDNAALLTLFKTSTGRVTAPASPQAPQTNRLADHVTTERKGTGTPTAVRRTDDNFEDAFDLHIKRR